MSTTTVRYVYYCIYFSDQGDYDFAIAVAGGPYVHLSPVHAATLFGIVYPGPGGDTSVLPSYITFDVDMHPGVNLNNPYPSGILMGDVADSVLVPGQPGVPDVGYQPPPPDPIEFAWNGIILKANPQGTAPPPAPNAMSQRRWIQGCELSLNGEGGTSGAITAVSRVAGRTNFGHGFVVRGQNNNSAIRRNVTDYITPNNVSTSWERFYFRLRSPGSASCGLWKTLGFPSSDSGAGLRVEIDGSIGVYMVNSFGRISVGNLGVVNLNTWYKFDIFLRYESGPSNGQIVIYINGLPIFNYTDTASDGLGNATRHVSSDLGKWNVDVGTDRTVEYDADDWMNAALPANLDSATLTFIDDNFPLDWLAGSHIRSVLTLSATMANWTPVNREVLNQGFAGSEIFNLSRISSTTSGAQIDGMTDHNNEQDEIAQKLGPIAAVVGDRSANPISQGKLGYRLAGGAPVLTTIPQNNIFLSCYVGYTPSGLITPPDIVPFHIVKEKSTDGFTDSTLLVQAAIEYLGTWGPEDDHGDTNANTIDFLHNCRYPASGWGYLGGVTDGPVFTVGGTYIGNGTFQDIDLPLPCHFLIIRPLNSAGGGIRFFGSSVTPALGCTEQGATNVRIWMDSLGQVKFTVTGVDQQCNANTVGYQYIAFCDPGMRYNICGAFNHDSQGLSPCVNDISYINPTWTPEFGWAQSVFIGTATGTIGLSVKGPGSIAGVNGRTLLGTDIPQWGDFTPGVFNSRSGIHASTATQVNYSLWRKADDVCGDILLQIFSYVGDGLASRILSFPDVTFRYPLFAHVQPLAATEGIFRDPSHTGANSSLANSMGPVGAGIIDGGVDSITVGSLLNQNGITYDVFIILGSDVGWLNGIYSPPSCEGAYQPPPTPPLPEIAVRGEGGLILGGTTAITLLKDVSGIYTLVPGKTDDTFIDRSVGVEDMEVKIPDPSFKTGYIGG